VRGLNVPAVTSAVVLREPVCLEAPRLVSRARLRGAFDHRYEQQRRELTRCSGTLPAAA
jgi:hypothetical protein